MKTLKTILHGFMITLLCVLLLCGCDSDYKPIEGVISDYDDESKIQVDFDDKETGKTSDNSAEQTTGEFSVKAKKYAFEGNDLLILDIHNQTNKDCDIDITVNYKDESGNVVKTEKQSFTGFAADYKNYFLFMPGIVFADYEYKIDAAKHDGDCPAQNVVFEKSGGWEEVPMRANYENYDYTVYPTIIAKTKYRNNNQRPIVIADIQIILDKNGEIYKVCKKTETMISAATDIYKSTAIYFTKEDKLTWPEELDGDCAVIIAVQSVTVH